MAETKEWRVHRFRNRVAIDIASGETVYLDREEAIVLARALEACAEDVRPQPSIGSHFGILRGSIKGLKEI